MKKKTRFPASRGEFRAIVITSSVICVSVILPPHLARIVQPVAPPQIEIIDLQSSYATADGAISDYSNDGAIASKSQKTLSNSTDRKVLDITKSKYNEHRNMQFQYIGSDDTLFKKDGNRDYRSVKSTSQTNGRNTASSYYTKAIRTNRRNYHRRPCSTFDPNSISSDSLQAWGISSYVASNIHKYLKSGGRFRKSEDLRQVYGMDSLMYGRISKCINIKKAPVKSVNVNTSDTTQWRSLPGIGPVLSRRIVKFRDKLGGFYSIDQVADTYGLPIETFEGIKGHLRINNRPKTMNLTTATEETLAAHPYISQKQARVMINYFNHHGRPKSLGDLSNMYIADSLWLARIRPYCTIDESDRK